MRVDTARIAEEGLILRCTVGSTIHGLHVAGTDDHDEMGVCIEPPEYVIGLETFEQDVFRTQPEGARSGPGDTDRVVYSLRKWTRLALNGNPTVLLLLFAPTDYVDDFGEELRAQAHLFASRMAGERFLGYLTAQKQRLLGERGQKRVKRPELEEAHGFDTKYAMHMLRLGHQGIEYLETGRLSLPMREPMRSHVYDVREGRVPINDVLTEVGELEARLRDLTDGGSPLPPRPAYDVVKRVALRRVPARVGLRGPRKNGVNFAVPCERLARGV